MCGGAQQLFKANRRARLACAGLVATALLMPTPAGASGFFLFSATVGEPGAKVVAHTGGEASFASAMRGRALNVYFVASDAVDAVTSVRDDRLTPVGRMRVDGSGNGTLTFRVPDVPAGDYETLVHCPPCAQASAGRTLLPFGPFEEPFQVLGSADGRRLTDAAQRVAILVCGVGLGILLARFRPIA